MNVDPYFTPCTKINSKWLADLSVGVKTIKLLAENTGVNLCDLCLGSDLLDTPLTAEAIKEKNA